jgi:hypothetical protein
MKIKLIKGWNGNSPGAILDPPIHAVATTLIDRGVAVKVEEEQPKSKKSKKDDPLF